MLTFAYEMQMTFLQTVWQRPGAMLILLMLLSFTMRFLSFFPSVIDHDESTYIIIADALRHGDIYLKDVIDTKPIGIFLLFAGFQSVLGKSIVVIRIITAVWVALTGWMLYLAHRRLLPATASTASLTAPAATGIIFVFATSVFTHYGVSPNTEIFFALFTATSLVILLSREGMGWIFLSGLLLGLGFMIKYVVVFDALALGLFMVWKAVTEKKDWTYWFWRGVVMTFGFVIPMVFTGWYYYRIGLWDTFYFFSFQLSSRYFIDSPAFGYVLYILENLGRFLPLTLWYYYSLRHWRVTGLSIVALGIIWSLLVWVIILLPGKLFGHYFIQFLLPLSLVAGSFFDPRHQPPAAWAWIRNRRVGYPLLAVVLCVNFIFQKIDYIDKPDYARQTADYLLDKLEPGDILYTGDFHQIVYYLTGTRSPTPYIHRSLIWEGPNVDALGIESRATFEDIFRQHPRFVLIEKGLKPEYPLYHWLYSSYHVTHQIDNRVFVYERNTVDSQ